MLSGLAVEVQEKGKGDARSVGRWQKWAEDVQGYQYNEERQWCPEPSLICRRMAMPAFDPIVRNILNETRRTFHSRGTSK